jgi:hypothetical protein
MGQGYDVDERTGFPILLVFAIIIGANTEGYLIEALNSQLDQPQCHTITPPKPSVLKISCASLSQVQHRLIS